MCANDYLQSVILRYLHGATMAGFPRDAIRIGILRFGNKVYTELDLGSAHTLREHISAILKIRYRNDDYNNVSGAIVAGIQMHREL